MMMSRPVGPESAHSLPVYPASAVTAIDGANLGDEIRHAAELNLGDVYMLATGARQTRLALAHAPQGDHLTVVDGTETGTPGADLHLDCCATFMSPNGATIEALILVELQPASGLIARIYLLPLAPMEAKTGYALVTLDRASARRRFAEAASVSFTRGTRITMASGRQVAIEDLHPGDTVLTRDHGVQKIRWVGQQTARAVGAFAPIRIAKGTLNNENDLVVSPNHRLFVYQRRDAVKAGRSEVLVKARHLLNGESVTRTDGGFVDYFQLLFDRHEIVYAEGIAAETMLVDTRTRPALPTDLRDAGVAGPLHGVELSEGAMSGVDAVEMLRRASAC